MDRGTRGRHRWKARLAPAFDRSPPAGNVVISPGIRRPGERVRLSTPRQRTAGNQGREVMLHPRIVLTAVLALAAGAPLFAQPPDPPSRVPRPDDDRIEVSLFVGEVL